DTTPDGRSFGRSVERRLEGRMNRLRSLCAGLLLVGLLAAPRPAHAFPKFAREYGVRCETCHSIPPRLNEFGLAFQANYFNWPAGKKAKNLSPRALPISGLAISSVDSDRTAGRTTTSFRDL